MAGKGRPAADIIGQSFGYLTVVSRQTMPYKDNLKRGFWNCLCSCGNVCIASSWQLRSGRKKSCSCMQGSARKTHGGSQCISYPSWNSMISRCYNPNNVGYKNYGGRGITVCDRWRVGEDGKSGFQCFFEDMGERPRWWHIDRRNNNGNYEPSNCRWVGGKQNQRNKGNSMYITINSETLLTVEWAEKTGIDYQTIVSRMRRGWSPEDAVSLPLQSYPRTKRDKRSHAK